MRNIIITGGELFNKGAEAMTFITVDELKKRFPKHNIYLLSEMDLGRPKEERDKYTFSFMGWYPMKFAKCQSNPFLRLVCKLKNGAELKAAEEIYRNTDFMIDISGYALGSNWGHQYVNTYLEHLEFAKAFHIPVFIMPQSFGPFDFVGEKGKELDKRIRELLPEVRVICAREEEGYRALVDSYHLDNVQLSKDIVLNNKSLDIKSVFKEEPQWEIPVIESNSIGIVPNRRIIEVGNSEEVYSLYYELIEHELSINHKVYLLSHSAQDIEICRNLKEYFNDKDSVILLDQDFSSIEFNEIVKQFLYVIASRFHSVVHAYKNGIPCIVLGWATKYHNLTNQFNQERYMVDVRNELNAEKVIEQLNYLDQHLQEERYIILKKLERIQETNVFDILTID